MNKAAIANQDIIFEKKSLTPVRLRKTGSKSMMKIEGRDEFVIQEDACPICFEDFQNDEIIRSLNHCCRHSFHEECISYWFQKSNRCPMCRAPQTKFGQLVHALFE
mgnify:CR=1 FL=1